MEDVGRGHRIEGTKFGLNEMALAAAPALARVTLVTRVLALGLLLATATVHAGAMHGFDGVVGRFTRTVTPPRDLAATSRGGPECHREGEQNPK